MIKVIVPATSANLGVGYDCYTIIIGIYFYILFGYRLRTFDKGFLSRQSPPKLLQTFITMIQ